MNASSIVTCRFSCGAITFAHIFKKNRLRTVFICAQKYISFAHSCTVTFAHVFTLLPWPAAGILINQGTTNKVSSLLPLFTGLGVKSFSSRSPGLFFYVVMFSSLPRRIIVSFSWVCKFPYASPQVYRLTFSFFSESKTFI